MISDKSKTYVKNRIGGQVIPGQSTKDMKDESRQLILM